ncbi:MAG: cell division protein FtsL [Syntrophaceae bacterium]|jgi:cell division protein FtsL|nr:cell division protein FtsL [Syntrophaceae bacterium]HOC59072.1 cell division protein FtsL [Smithellaceae bacterium]HQM45525.1 cell division protein FtsL [Smithellaceae bacterium]
MAQTAEPQVIGKDRAVQENGASTFGMQYSTCILVAIVLMFVALIYVGSHIRMTKMEYEIAAALNTRDNLKEEQRRLKLELATLKSPQRIEDIARNKLQMTYPTAQQVISLTKAGKKE